MNTKISSILLCLLLLAGVAHVSPLRSNNVIPYDTLWNRLKQLEEQSLPESSGKIAGTIYQKALKERNSPQLLKSIIHLLKYQWVTDKDLFPEKLQEIETYTAQTTDVAEKSVLHTMLANLYLQYYNINRRSIDRRTALDNHIPNDMREWTGNIFIRKIIDHINRALQPVQLLQSTDILTYKEILTTGDASRNLRPTLYDFLVAESILILDNAGSLATPFFKQTQQLNNSCFRPAEEFAALTISADTTDLTMQILKLYVQLIRFRLQENNPQALIMADLDRLEYVYKYCKSESYDEALHTLQKKYEKEPFAVEVISRRVNCYFPQDTRPMLKTISEEEEADNRKKAYDLCRAGIQKYPDYERIGLLKNTVNALTIPSFRATMDNVVYPGKQLQLKLTSQNIPHLQVNIYRIDLPIASYVKSGVYKTNGRLVEKKSFHLNNSCPYHSYDTLLTLPVGEPGLYEIVFSALEKTEVQTFSVSKLSVFCRPTADKREYLVTDRISGKPIEKAVVRLYNRSYNKSKDEYELIASVTTDKNGLAAIPTDDKYTFYQAVFQNDTCMPVSYRSYHYTSSDNDVKTVEKTDIFTDRAIYRPGQTVFFKGIITRAGKDNGQEVVSKVSTPVKLFDSQGKELSKMTCTSNEFGSFSGEFILPKEVLNGYFSIVADRNNGYCSFRVEEYKRPAFDIVMDTIAATYSFGDTIPVVGTVRTFSGILLQQQAVNFRVTRKKLWRWLSLPASGAQIAFGTVETDEDGRFRLSFPAEKPQSDSSSKTSGYVYEVEVSVTNSSGETQQNTVNIAVGDRSMYLDIATITTINKDRLQALPIRAFNLNDKEVICDVDYRIVRLSAGQVLGKNLDENDWKEEATVASGTFSTRDSLRLTGFRKMPSGKYRLFLQTKDDKGREIIEKQDFMLYSFQDKRPPVVQYEWLVAENTTCAPGENVEILYGSSAENAYVLFELYQNGKNLERKRFVLNNENKKLIIPFKASYGNGVSVTFTFIKDAQLFTEALIINRKQEDKSLRLKMDVFRNKLLPGQTEEWKLSVRDAHGKPVPSEVLANMYDFSLDKIYRNDWYFYPASIFYRNDPPVFYADGAFMNGTASFYIDKKSVDVPEFAFDAFNWFGLDFHSKMLYSLRSSVSMDNAAGAFLVRGNAPVQKENLTEVVMHVSEETARQDNATKHASQEPEMTPEPVLIRGNFNETAFFYPQLRTNDAGETVIAFTVPESNTAWKFRTLAHTKDAGYGSLTEQVVTRKPLMVAPNMPRFVRWGDNITLTTNISNASDSLQSGKIQIELLDPQTEKPLIIPAENIRAFSIEKGQTAAISWSFHIPGKIDLLTCKIIARSEHFSDGEQHILPVLPNRLQVTESLPLPISGKGDKQFTFDKLLHDTSTTAENYRLTLEFASNPAWYAIQALHAMGTPQDESVISWFSAYYTNSLATSIANRTPKIKQIIDSWNRQTGTVDTFRSNLEKNPELKTVLSEETPWVLDASNETEQKQRLSLLFDANRNRYLVSEAVGKLKEIQLEDGGWSWFKGMYSTIPVTHWILYGLGQLERLNALQQQDITGEIQRKALSFIDREFKKSFENLKKSNPNYAKLQIIGNYALEYLYVRSFYPDISPEGTEEALAFYLDLIDKYWSKTGNLYQRALAAMILQRNGRAATAAKIAQSLREHATRKPETGMYWANNSPHCFYFQSAVSVHTFIMQALTETGVSQEDTDAMKLWLLKQKQTQRWESTPATVNAIYALLNTGSDWLNSEGQTDIRLGKQTIRTDNGEAGTGYIKKVFHASEIQPDMGNIAVSKHDDGPAYGALYRQYYEDMDKITQAGNNLRIDKKLFVEKISETNRIIVPATDSEPVSVGDKVIVRLTVRVDNDMEYLALKDVRAACFEPVEQVSGIQWKESVAYYRTNRDASTCFYFDHLPKGTHVFEYALYATRPGEYFGGITTIQCLYAPEFTAHTEGRKLRVRRKD